MEYISAKEAAAKWGIHIRLVQNYCKNGRISGARKYGVSWMLPADTAKPIDPRKARKQPELVSSPYLTCGLLSALIPMPMGNPDAVIATLPDEKQRAQYAAELSYLRGDFEAVKSYYAGVSPEDETYICACHITIAAAMATRDYPLFKSISTAVKNIEENSQSQKTCAAAAMLSPFASVCMNAPELAPTWLVNNDFSEFSAQARPLLIFMRVKYLQSIGDFSGMLAAAQTAHSLFMCKDQYTLVDIYLTCFCACGSYALERLDEARDYLDKSIEMCESGGFVSPLGEYTTWVGGLLEISLKKSSPNFEKAVLNHIERTLKNWLFFHNEFTRDNASLILTTKEYQLALLLKEGKTYKQAADQLCLSVGRTRNLVTVIYQKLGISKKSEIGNYVY